MVPLRVRSSFSLLRGTASPAELCHRAHRFGYRRLALTDEENLYGLWAFLAACREHGIRPLIGSEIRLADTAEKLVLLVENDAGYRNLCSIISTVKKNGPFNLRAESAHLFAGLVLLAGSETILQRCREFGLVAAADLGSRPSERASRLRRCAAGLGMAAVATPDSDLAGHDQLRTHLLLRAIAGNTTLSDEKKTRPSRACATGLEPPDVYRRRFAVWPEVVRATEAIAERCGFTRPAHGLLMVPWRQAGGLSAGQVLREQAFAGAGWRYGTRFPDSVTNRLEYELTIIEKMGFSSYFLAVRDIVRPLQADGSRKERRICGRGSGAASLVAYCLGITNVCPIRYNLYFERFLNPGRSDPPDIDIDFAWDERDAVLSEVLGLHGERAAMVCNHVCFQPRMAIRETAKAFGLPGYEISRMTKQLPWFFRRSEMSLQEQITPLPSLKDQDFSGPWPAIMERAEALIGLPRYLSVHPGGVVITADPLTNHVPVEQAAKGVPIIQWEKDGAEEAGLIKIDLLGNRSLGVIRDAVINIRANDREFAEAHWHPEDDLETQAVISSGRTMGCFYIESPAMRLLQQKAGSGDFEQLVIQSSIIRPAANEFVREYVRRLHGGSWQPLHPALEDVLEETFGLMVYQEDVSRVAVALAGFSHSEADGLRKILSKKDRQRRLGDYRLEFYRGCLNNGLDEQDIEPIWAMMMSFDGYSFCKPHSASYARVSFQAAYLKTHFPAEFMAAVISNQGGYYSTFSYVSEARRMGLAVDPPDVLISDCHWRGNGSRLRVGLQALRGLSQQTAARIVSCRRKRVYRDFADFLQRLNPADDEIRSLIDSGALDTLNPGGFRSQLFWELAVHSARKAMGRTERTEHRRTLFSAPRADPPPLDEHSRLEQLRREYRALGFLCRTHPVTLVKNVGVKTVKGRDLRRYIGRSVNFVGVLLTGKIVSTKTGEVMEFLSFEDDTAIVEATFFPRVYQRYAHLLSGGKAYLLNGLVEVDFGAITLTVNRLKAL